MNDEIFNVIYINNYLIPVVAEIAIGQVFAVVAGFARAAERKAQQQGHEQKKEDGPDGPVHCHF